MDVVITHETKATGSGSYHLLNDAQTASRCGSINEESQFASESYQTLSRAEAERRELDACGRCTSIAEDCSAERSATDD